MIAAALRDRLGELGPTYRCNQCWLRKARASFPDSSTHECRTCLRRRRNGYERRGRHADLDERRVLRVQWRAKSNVDKLGGIPCSTTAGFTCPTSCSMRGDGCYAEFGHGGAKWRQLSRGELGVTWPRFLELVRALPAGQLWRHNLAGDLPGAGNNIAPAQLLELVRANAGRRGFTFTHKPPTSSNVTAVRRANAEGLTVNWSADNLREADKLAELEVAPVVVVLPRDAPVNSYTPRGRHVVVCPSQRRAAVTCASCQLCAEPDRSVIIGFRAHGQMNKRVSLRVLKGSPS